MKPLDEMMITRRFLLEGFELKCQIGAYEHERLAPQRVIIDAELTLSVESEPTTDRLETTLNYDQIRNSILKIAGEQHFDLQETLARRIFDAMAELPNVSEVRVRTAKPDAYQDCKEIAYELSGIVGFQD